MGKIFTTIVGSTLCGIAYHVYLAKTAVPMPPPSPPIAPGKTRICVAGYSYMFTNPKAFIDTAKAHYVADAVVRAQPHKYETWYYWTMLAFYKFLAQKFDAPGVVFPEKDLLGKPLKGHADTSPFCWIESGEEKKITPIGGLDAFAEWVRQQRLLDDKDTRDALKATPSFQQCFHRTHGNPGTTEMMAQQQQQGGKR